MGARAERREDALVTALTVTDTARRVGWAKYFTEVERADELSRDLNVATADTDIVLRFAGYVYGLLTVAAPETLQKLPPSVDRLGLLSLLPSHSVDAGKRAARRPRVKKVRNGRLSDGEVVHFVSDLMRERKEARDNDAKNVEVGEPLSIINPSRNGFFAVIGRALGGAIIQQQSRKIFVDAGELNDLIRVLEAVRSADKHL